MSFASSTRSRLRHGRFDGTKNTTNTTPTMAQLTINIASVKVMRSYDYCHFEVSLSSSVDCPVESPEWFSAVDGLRKNAARLVDKAVDQYKVAKNEATKFEHVVGKLEYEAEKASNVPCEQRTPEQMAAIKAHQDAIYRRNRYNYQYDWEEMQDED